MSSSNINKPWLDQAGNFLADKEIKISSKLWSQEIWDAYLYESGTEKPMSSYESTYSTYSELLKRNEYEPKNEPSTHVDLSPYLENLKKDSKILLHLTYWEDRPLTEVSEAIGRTYFKTKTLKHKTLEELRLSLFSDAKIMRAYYETN